MKKIISLALALIVLFSTVSALAEIVYPNPEKTKITMWMQLDNGNSQVYTSLSDSEQWKRYQEATGVEIEFIHPSIGAPTEGFATMIAGDMLPDVIVNFAEFYNGGLEAGYDDEVIIDLTPYLEEYAPDYLAQITQSDDVYKQFATADGKVLAFDEIFGEFNDVAERLHIHPDWCEEFGMDPAELDTYDEIEKYFQAILDNKPGVVPFMPVLSNTDKTRLFTWGYDFIQDFMVIDGQVVYYANLDNYRDWLRRMHSWYEKGYLGADFASNKGATCRKAFAAHEAGCICVTVGSGYADAVAAGNPADHTKPWMQNEGDACHCFYLGVDVNNGYGAVITTACDEDKIPAIVQFLNYGYTEQGIIDTNWGYEGYAWNYDENGNRKYVDDVINNPNVTTSVTLYLYRNHQWPRVRLADTNCNPNIIKDQVVIDLRMRYFHPENFSGEYVISTGVKMPVEDAISRAELMTDIETYVSESMYAFIKGDKNIETDWDAYVAQLKKFKLDEAIAYTQAAYDLYISK